MRLRIPTLEWALRGGGLRAALWEEVRGDGILFGAKRRLLEHP
jgi:hypothetical protein